MGQDLRYGLRMLLKSPGFTLVAVVTLALGIGATTAIFSVVNAVLLRPLPYREPGQLARVYSEFPTMNLRKFAVSPPEFFDLRNEAKSWEALGGWSMGGANLSAGGEPIRVTAAAVTGGLVEALGVGPALGRSFTPEEDRPSGPRVAMISDGLWRRAFGGQREIIGKAIEIDAQPYTVVGVMPPGYAFPPGSNDQAEVWAPLQLDPADASRRASHFLSVIGRLKPGVTLEQARAESDALVENWRREQRAQHLFHARNHPVLMAPLHEEVVSGARAGVLTLMGAVAFVLLISCVNVASLLLARADARHREFAVRLALGAGRRRLLRQFVTEGLILVVLGGGLGIAFAAWGLDLILAAAPDSVPRAAEVAIDRTVLGFTLGISVLVVFLFALAPMAQVGERNLSDWLRSAGRRAAGGGGGQRLRKALVVTEVALAVMLVTGSGLMLRAFWKLQQVDLNFDARGLLTFRLELPGEKYQRPDRLRFASALEERLARLPGVRSASLVGGLPPERPINANDTRIEGFQPTPEAPAQNVDYWNTVGLDYFKTMGIRTVEGRTFEPTDGGEKAQQVVVINQALARRFWKGSPLGRRVSPDVDATTVWFTIVGVVEDAKNAGVDKPAGPELYFLREQAASRFGLGANQNYVVRVDGNPAALTGAVRAAVGGLDPGIPIYDLKPMTDAVADSLVRPRFLSVLLATFALIALLLAAVGIYGVMAYSVEQRTHEIGIRMALGARKADVLRLVLGQAVALQGAGTLLGLAGAFALTRLMASLLYEVTPSDPPTYVGVVGLLGAVALLAGYVPARRAAKVDPMVALRYE